MACQLWLTLITPEGSTNSSCWQNPNTPPAGIDCLHAPIISLNSLALYLYIYPKWYHAKHIQVISK